MGSEVGVTLLRGDRGRWVGTRPLGQAADGGYPVEESGRLSGFRYCRPCGLVWSAEILAGARHVMPTVVPVQATKQPSPTAPKGECAHA